MTLTLTFGRFFQKKFCIDMGVCRIYCNKIILIGAKLWPVGGVTDKQTNRWKALGERVLCDADMDTGTCTDSLPQFIWCWLKVKLWPGHMCTKFQINRSTIDDFRNSEKCQLSLTSRDEKTWLRTSSGLQYFRSGCRQRTFCNQLEVSTTSD